MFKIILSFKFLNAYGCAIENVLIFVIGYSLYYHSSDAHLIPFNITMSNQPKNKNKVCKRETYNENWDRIKKTLLIVQIPLRSVLKERKI